MIHAYWEGVLPRSSRPIIHSSGASLLRGVFSSSRKKPISASDKKLKRIQIISVSNNHRPSISSLFANFCIKPALEETEEVGNADGRLIFVGDVSDRARWDFERSTVESYMRATMTPNRRISGPLVVIESKWDLENSPYPISGISIASHLGTFEFCSIDEDRHPIPSRRPGPARWSISSLLK